MEWRVREDPLIEDVRSEWAYAADEPSPSVCTDGKRKPASALGGTRRPPIWERLLFRKSIYPKIQSKMSSSASIAALKISSPVTPCSWAQSSNFFKVAGSFD